jgi:asparagine synthase (glutamine-hydrolysing)
MCGIVGIYNHDVDNKVNIQKIELLKNTIKHRGPDGDGIFVDKYLALAHTRLSIIDLKTGSQPMASYNNEFVIIFNGEIYNYLDLRKKLIKNNHIFLTNSDTEVIINSYIEWGTNCFNKLNGEWAIAIWDKRKKELILCRDRYGIKPLYYLNNTENFVFSSEIKSFTSLYDLEIDKNELWDLLVFGPKPGGSTHLKGVNELQPGSFLTFSKRKFSLTYYYELENSLNKDEKSLDLENVEYLVIDSVKKRLMSDVKIGTINSGGLDSSFISKIASKYYYEKINTFSVAPEKVNGQLVSGDESKYAEIISNEIKSKHRTIRYSVDEFINNIKNCLFYNDGLLYHSNSIPLSIMFKKIKEEHNIKVILGGEGADEVFRGYSINKISGLYSKIGSQFGKNIFAKLFDYRYPSTKKFTTYFDNPNFYMQLGIDRNRFLDPDFANNLLGIKGQVSDDRVNLIKKNEDLPIQNQLIYYEQKCYLVGLLQRIDRMSMQWGVEARVPFLDHRLVNYMNSISANKKSGIREKNVKVILKKIAKDHISSTIINRKKYGFATPMEHYQSKLSKQIAKYQINQKLINIESNSFNDIFLIYNYYLLINHFKNKN